MFEFCRVSEEVYGINENEKKESVFISEGKMNFELLIKCTYAVISDNEEIKVKYSLIAENDNYRPFGINAKLIDSFGKVIAEENVVNKFSTISEVICAIRMLAKETVLPFTIEDVLV